MKIAMQCNPSHKKFLQRYSLLEGEKKLRCRQENKEKEKACIYVKLCRKAGRGFSKQKGAFPIETFQGDAR